MRLRGVILLLLVVCVACAGSAYAAKRQKAYIKLVEASRQAVAATDGGGNRTTTRLVIVWLGPKYPETFFWRGDNGWLPCKIEKAHKASRPVADYTTEDITNDAIHKGDTLLLTPVSGGRFPIPAEIPAKAKNTLYYKTGGGKWMGFAVKVK